jgi:1-acyl-sn-glycerol-3-phosphate acyltransferase
MRRVGDRLLEFGYTGYVGALLALTLPVLWVLVHLSRRGQPVHRLVRTWCRIVLALGGCPVQVVGFESLGGTGPAVFAANHASYVDALVLVAVLPPGCRFVAKRELADAPLIGSVLRKGGHLVVGRADLSRSVADAERVTAALRGGMSPVVFPEGTFVRRPGLLPFRLGAFKAAVEAQCPVIPIAVSGTREILPADTWLLRPGRICVTALPPARPQGSGWLEMVRVRDLTHASIASRLGERRPTEAPADDG